MQHTCPLPSPYPRPMPHFDLVIIGTGSALPKRRVDNAEMAVMVDTSDEWIRERTGITQRYFAGEGETTSTLATEAARRALADAGLTIADIDLIVLATATPYAPMPKNMVCAKLTMPV